MLAAAARLLRLDVVGVIRGERGSMGVRTLHEVVVDGLAAAHRRCWHVLGDVLVRRVLVRRCPGLHDVRPQHGVLHLGVEDRCTASVSRQGLVDVVSGRGGCASPAVDAVASGVDWPWLCWPCGDGEPRCCRLDGDGSSGRGRRGCAWWYGSGLWHSVARWWARRACARRSAGVVAVGDVAAGVAVEAVGVVLRVGDVDDRLHETAPGAGSEGLLKRRAARQVVALEDAVPLVGELRPREVVVLHRVHELVEAVGGETAFDGADVVDVRLDHACAGPLHRLRSWLHQVSAAGGAVAGVGGRRSGSGCRTSLTRTCSGGKWRRLGRGALGGGDHAGVGVIARRARLLGRVVVRGTRGALDVIGVHGGAHRACRVAGGVLGSALGTLVVRVGLTVAVVRT